MTMATSGRRAAPPRVAVLIETSMAYGREMLLGVSDYLKENGPWTVYFEHRSLLDPAPPWLADWRGEGIIARLAPQLADLVLRLGVPTVNIDDQAPRPGVPNIQSDHEGIGALAFDHLHKHGYQRFAFVGHPCFEWSVRRRDGFIQAADEAGRPHDLYFSKNPVSWGHQQASWESEMEDLGRWLAERPKPLGVMACNDFVGVRVLEACRRMGFASPDEVGVIGVDNDLLACELANPPLSSVIPDCRQVGYEAAALLDALMRGERPPAARRDTPPRGVAVRPSTDAAREAGDPMVNKAVRFIQERARDGIRVDDVLEYVGVSRTVLQRRFRRVSNQTIHGMIAEVRLRFVKQLLVETDLSLPEIAGRTGYARAEYLSAVFRQAVGSSPGRFRRESRAAARPSELANSLE